MKNKLNLLLCIVFSTAPSHSFARSDCPHTINLNTIKLLADKKKGDILINESGENWEVENNGNLEAVMNYLNDPQSINLKIVTKLDHAQHKIEKAHHGAETIEKLYCTYVITAQASGRNQRSGVTLTYIVP